MTLKFRSCVWKLQIAGDCLPATSRMPWWLSALLRGKQSALNSLLQAASMVFQWGASCSWSYFFQTYILVNCGGCLSVLIYVMWVFFMSCGFKIEFSVPTVCFSCPPKIQVLNGGEDISTKCGTEPLAEGHIRRLFIVCLHSFYAWFVLFIFDVLWLICNSILELTPFK